MDLYRAVVSLNITRVFAYVLVKVQIDVVTPLEFLECLS